MCQRNEERGGDEVGGGRCLLIPRSTVPNKKESNFPKEAKFFQPNNFTDSWHDLRMLRLAKMVRIDFEEEDYSIAGLERYSVRYCVGLKKKLLIRRRTPH